MKLENLKEIDDKVIKFMKVHGERVETFLLGGYFIWFGLLKLFGGKSASSIIAKTIYWFEPSFVVPFLGLWEVFIGVSLVFYKLHRLAILFLFLRIPGIILALVYHYDECFSKGIFEPSIQGQYLIKELTLVGAALVIGSSIRKN